MSDSRWQMVPVPSLIINRELKQRRRRRQRERQKIGKKATLHVHHAFLYISLHHYTTTTRKCLFQRFYRGREQEKDFLFFFRNFDTFF